MSSALQLIAIGAMVIALLAGHALAVPYPQVGGTPTRHSRPVTISAFVPSDWETLPLPQTRYVHGSLGGNATTIYATGLVTLSAPAITTTVAGPAFTDTYTFPGTTVTQNQTDIIVLSGSSVQEIHIDPSSAKFVAYCGVEADGTELSCEQYIYESDSLVTVFSYTKTGSLGPAVTAFPDGPEDSITALASLITPAPQASATPDYPSPTSA